MNCGFAAVRSLRKAALPGGVDRVQECVNVFGAVLRQFASVGLAPSVIAVPITPAAGVIAPVTGAA